MRIHSQEVVVAVRRPTVMAGVALDFRLSHRMNSRMDFGEGAVLPEGLAGSDGGVMGLRDSRVGQLAFRLSGGRDGGRVWQASFVGASSFHQIAAARWRKGDQGVRLTLPSAEIDGTSRTSADGTAALAKLRWPRGRFLGTALGVEWTHESFDPTEESGTVGLGAVIPVTRESTEWRADLRLVQPVLVSLSHRRARTNADGALNENSQRAARRFYGRLDSEGWSAGLERAKLTLDGEDWLVTGLGFGRTDQRSLDDFKVIVLLIGGELRFEIPSPSGEAVVHVGGSAPIHADWNHPLDDDSSGAGWVGRWRRWANVNLGISWSLDR